ncbi:uncharacterized protein LOC124417001 isoform X1 [Gallus gallus]|uniref:uncharacterized protein LOC124417001 isoform X1 n=1 Tax=Gallus gallus TaxID=9031 RepID=UPI001EFFA340|nr:uncharacterized protein LOC124417001 isoform X1 [Gallus gallus]
MKVMEKRKKSLVRMEQRSPSCHQKAWPEKPMISQASRPQWGTDEVCEMQVPLGSGEGPSASDMSPQQEDPLSCIRACCMCRPQAEAQKLSFLASICTICEAALEDSGAHYRLCVCPLEVAQCIEGAWALPTKEGTLPHPIPYHHALRSCCRRSPLSAWTRSCGSRP